METLLYFFISDLNNKTLKLFDCEPYTQKVPDTTICEILLNKRHPMVF